MLLLGFRFDRFDPARRLDASEVSGKFLVMESLFGSGTSFLREVSERRKESRVSRGSTGGSGVKKRKVPLRQEDPW